VSVKTALPVRPHGQETKAMADRESALTWLSSKSYRVVVDHHPLRVIVERLIDEGRAEWLGCANRARTTRKVRVGGPGDTGCYARTGKPCDGYHGSGCRHCGRIVGSTVPTEPRKTA
jgi:hypothetical protein